MSESESCSSGAWQLGNGASPVLSTAIHLLNMLSKRHPNLDRCLCSEADTTAVLQAP